MVAGGYWLVESVLHYLVFDDATVLLLPRDANEFWMRTLTVLIILTGGLLGDQQLTRLREKDARTQAVHHAMLHSSHHILNNLLNQMLVVRMALEDGDDAHASTLQTYDAIVAEATTLIRQLETVPTLAPEAIRAAVAPGRPTRTESAPRPAD